MEFTGVGYILPPPPTLGIENLGGTVRLNWPSSAASWKLYSTPVLSPSSVWLPTGTAIQTNGLQTLTLTNDSSGAFYRLQKP